MKSKPFRKVYFNINSRCNYDCIGCLLPKSSRIAQSSEISVERFNAVLGEVLPRISGDDDYNIFEISGGEPTIHPEFHRIVSLLRQQAKVKSFRKLVVLTNGHRLGLARTQDSIWDGINDVVISIYSPVAEINDMLCGRHGSLKCKLDAAEKAIQKGIRVHLKAIVMKPSYKQLPTLANLLTERFGSRIHFTVNAMHMTGDAWRNHGYLAVRCTEAAPYIERALDIAIASGQDVSLFFPLCMVDPCYWEYASVDYQNVVQKSLAVMPNGQWGPARRLLKEFIHRHPVCEACPIGLRCNWPWEDYVRNYGDSEITKGCRVLFPKSERRT